MKKMPSFNYNKIVSYTILLTIVLIGIGYSSFERKLYIDGVGVTVRVKSDARITAVNIEEASNETMVNWQEYNVKNITSSVSLPYSDSYVIYKVEVTVFENGEVGILNIDGLPDNLEWSLLNYNLQDKICDDSNKCNLGIKKEILIKVNYKEGKFNENQVTHNIRLNFDIRPFHKITYTKIVNYNYPSEILEGGDIEVTFKKRIPKQITLFVDGVEKKDFSYFNNTLKGKNIEGNLEVRKTSTELYDVLGDNNIGTSPTADNPGVYLYKGEESNSFTYPVYYYNGAVNNNNVIFGDFCWKIIRTTETGGIKLIYNGVPIDSKCNNSGTASELSEKSPFNNDAKSLKNSGYIYNDADYTVGLKSGNLGFSKYSYGNDVTFDGTNYSLVDVEKYSVTGSPINRHYTFYGDQDNSTVKFVFKKKTLNTYYITLSNGKKIKDALDEMLGRSSEFPDNHPSVIKNIVDSWYQTNMLRYNTYIEDTPFCNDRTISNYGGWDPNTGSLDSKLEFRALNTGNPEYYTSASLTCENHDLLSVKNGKMTYPVGIITAAEGKLAYVGGASEKFYLDSGESYWTMSASYYDSASGATNSAFYLDNATITNGDINQARVTDAYGVRPVLSLNYLTEKENGDGTESNPYTIKMNQ